MSFTGLLIHRCSVKIPQYSGTTTYGNRAAATPDTTRFLDVPCRVEQLSGNEQNNTHRGVVSSHVFYFGMEVLLSASTIVENDYIEVDGAKFPMYGGTYQVTFVDPISDGVATHHIEVYAKKVETRDEAGIT